MLDDDARADVVDGSDAYSKLSTVDRNRLRAFRVARTGVPTGPTSATSCGGAAPAIASRRPAVTVAFGEPGSAAALAGVTVVLPTGCVADPMNQPPPGGDALPPLSSPVPEGVLVRLP